MFITMIKNATAVSLSSHSKESPLYNIILRETNRYTVKNVLSTLSSDVREGWGERERECESVRWGRESVSSLDGRQTVSNAATRLVLHLRLLCGIPGGTPSTAAASLGGNTYLSSYLHSEK